ncbi:hypothetical protein [uncultured Aquimarina sp.]|uniref:hypothetical protein n=1 Tax=uncultured Aquimarina sp. TaxID=575652 RepID=UPI00260D091E|nr:hypothetical protein [uncultured Aquimarina sp.]
MSKIKLLRNILSLISNDYVIFTGIFFAASFIGILNHELWLDEAHHWLLARDSISISNLITNTRYEGHPILWNIILFYISRISLDPFWMQFLHIIISSTVVFIFFKNAPFSRLFKIMFIFGYFMFFEYNLVSRNYAIGVLFLFLACSVYKSRKERFVLFAILLAIANNTHAIFIVITSCLIFVTLIECIQEKGRFLNSKISIGITIFVIGTLLSVLQIIPPSDTSFFERAENFSLLQRISKSFITFFKGVFVISDFRTIHFWNSHLIVNLNKSFAAVLGILSLSIPCFLFFKNKFILLYVYLGILGTGGFFFVTQLSAPRYFGMNFLIIITALWMEHYHSFKKNLLNSSFSRPTLQRIKKGLLYSILGIQMISGVTAYSFDFFLPFSGSKQTITYLKKSNLIGKVIITKWCGGTPLSSYLEKPVFFTNANNFQSYCIWNRQNSLISNSEIKLINTIENTVKNEEQSVIFISLEPLNLENVKNINDSMEYQFLKSFNKNIVSKESYYIYEISKK